MKYPTSVIHGSTTECLYSAKQGTAAALITYETNASNSTFASSQRAFEARGLKLGAVRGLGDQAYYFNEQTGQGAVSTVVVLKTPLQVLVTGSGTIDQVGAIARYALTEFVATGSSGAGASG
jgi:hypothetical protein